jgi:hypothetical protein
VTAWRLDSWFPAALARLGNHGVDSGMGKYIRFVSIKERVPARIDGTEFEYVFEVGSLRGDAFVAEKRYVLDIQASGTLQAVWRVSSEQMARIAAALATPYVLELAREDRLAELSPFKLNTYSAPKSPPEETRVEPGHPSGRACCWARPHTVSAIVPIGGHF